MKPRLITPLALLIGALAGCAGNTIVPNYETSNPNLRVGGEPPVDLAPTVENAGSFCLQVTEQWHEDGQTPDGQKLYAKDTQRKVVPCKP
jgi:hypothetical protein